MTLAGIGAPADVQGNSLSIGVPDAGGFCTSVQLSDLTHWCTDSSLEIGVSTAACTAAVCPGF
jgi:hypothetical protein